MPDLVGLVADPSAAFAVRRRMYIRQGYYFLAVRNPKSAVGSLFYWSTTILCIVPAQDKVPTCQNQIVTF